MVSALGCPGAGRAELGKQEGMCTPPASQLQLTGHSGSWPRAAHTQSVSTHSEAWRRPALLRHNAELAHAEAHVFADESGHLHAPNEAVTTVQHRRHCSHKKRWARETAQSCCCSPEAQPELRAAVEGRGGWMGTGPPLLPHGSGASGLHALGLQPVPPGMALGVVVRVPACSLCPAEGTRK